MITGLYSAIADSIPILCITGQAPTAVLHKEDFQAVDIASIAKPVTKAATTVLEAAQVPGVFQRAFHLMRTGRPGPVLIDLPIDVQLTEIEFDPDLYEPLPVHKPAATRRQIVRALDLLNESERPLLVAGGGIINADASGLLVEFAELTGVPVVPTLMGWGIIADDHELNAGMVGLQTSHRYGNANFLESDFVLGIGNRWANRHTGRLDVYTEGRKFVHVDIEPTQLGKIFAPDLGIASDAKAALELFVEVARELKAAGKLKDRSRWAAATQERRATLQRRTHFDNVPLKPQRVYEEMNRAFGPETRYVTTIGLSQIMRRADAARLPAAPLDQLRPGGPARLDHPGRAGRRHGRPGRLRRRALRRLRLPVHAGGAGRRRTAPHPVRPRPGEQLLPGADPPGAAQLRHRLPGQPGVREPQLAGARRVRRRPRQGRRGPGLQGHPGHRAGPAAARPSRRPRSWPRSSGCRWSSRRSWSASRTSR